MKVKVSKEFVIDSAHHLPNYPGKCANLHGHRWSIIVSIKGGVNPETGMVIDFTEIKDIMKPLIERLDHSDLNTTLINPTAENLGIYILDYVQSRLKGYEIGIVIKESPDNIAEVTQE